MKRRFWPILALLAAASLLISACDVLSPTPAPTPLPSLVPTIAVPNQPATVDPRPIIDAVIGTLNAQAATQTAGAPTATRTLIPSQTPVPSLTRPASGTQSAETATPGGITGASAGTTTGTPAPCNRAAFVADLTIPDNTALNPGVNFVKSWRMRNTGSCAWNNGYKVVFDHGSAMNAPTSSNISKSVGPGDTMDISMTLTAPQASGTYEAFFRLMDPNGEVFGNFSVRIIVGSTAAPFSVSHVLTSVDSAAVNTLCPPGHIFTFTANITTTAPGSVVYYWQFSDGSKSSSTTLAFASAGTQTVTGTWDLGAAGPVAAGNPFAGWGQIYIDQPNHQAFDQVPFTLSCIK